MIQKDMVLRWLTAQAKDLELGLDYGIYGEVSYDPAKNQKFITQSMGAVYGLWVKVTTEEDLEALFDEVANDGCSMLSALDEFSPVAEGWYPLYWGKDTNLGSRVRAHVTNPKGTGNANIFQYPTLHRLKIIYGGIYVPSYQKFELHLHRAAPPLIGSTKRGSAPRLVQILLNSL